MNKDPIKQLEDILRNFHDRTGEYTQPVLSRYPLLFSFLIIFSVAAIIHGFEMWADSVGFFTENPGLLMLLGILALLFTGMLYKSLDKMK